MMENVDARPRGQPPPSSASSLIDLATLMRIEKLELRAKAIVEGFWSGLHRSPQHGFSVEFTEYRQYSPGDDPRYLDWKLFARSDRYYIKRFEEETNLRCTLLVDQSRSMGFGSLSYSKADYAATLAATLAHFLFSQRDAVGLLAFDRDVTEYIPARFRVGHLHQIMTVLQRPAVGAGTDLARMLEKGAELITKRGLIILISDLLAPLEPLRKGMSYLRTRGHDVVVFQLLDPAEATFEFGDSALFVDVETGRDLFVDPRAIRDDYLRRLGKHCSAAADACESLGIEYHRVGTDEPLELVLFDFVRARLLRGAHARNRL